MVDQVDEIEYPAIRAWWVGFKTMTGKMNRQVRNIADFAGFVGFTAGILLWPFGVALWIGDLTPVDPVHAQLVGAVAQILYIFLVLLPLVFGWNEL